MKKGMVGVLGGILGATVGALAVGKVTGKTIDEKQGKVDKFKSYYNMLNQWLSLKQEGKSLDEYFKENNYKTIAIYGMGEMGNRLYEELKNTEVEVKYVIDKNAESTYSELDVMDIDDEMPQVDVVIITAVFAFDEIMENIEDKFDCPIISLEDVVYEV